jgi:hypothetical protein
VAPEPIRKEAQHPTQGRTCADWRPCSCKMGRGYRLAGGGVRGRLPLRVDVSRARGAAFVSSAAASDGCRAEEGEGGNEVVVVVEVVVDAFAPTSPRASRGPERGCSASYSDAKGANRHTLRFGTARQKAALERWTHPKPQRRARSPRYGVPSRRGVPAGVA